MLTNGLIVELLVFCIAGAAWSKIRKRQIQKAFAQRDPPPAALAASLQSASCRACLT